MPQQTISKPKQRRKSNSKVAELLNQQKDSQESDNESVENVEQDSDEEELNRLVLGDSAGFLEQLGADARDLNSEGRSDQEEEGEEEEAGLEGVDDADVSIPDIFAP